MAEFRSVVKDTKSNTKYFTKSISIHSDYHYENLSLKMTLQNHSYSEIRYYKRSCGTDNLSVLSYRTKFRIPVVYGIGRTFIIGINWQGVKH